MDEGGTNEAKSYMSILTHTRSTSTLLSDKEPSAYIARSVDIPFFSLYYPKHLAGLEVLWLGFQYARHEPPREVKVHFAHQRLGFFQ